MSLESLYEEMKGCHACRVRSGCTQVITAVGQMESPKLLVIGEAPGQADDEEGQPFIGPEGEVLREALRQTRILNRENTLLTNVLKCCPPKFKFPTDDSAVVCVSKWLWREIEIAKPQRMLLLGNTPLKYVAGMEKVTACRGNWYDIRGIRTMVTYHPKYVIRTDSKGDMSVREMFERDIMEVAIEVEGLQG